MGRQRREQLCHRSVQPRVDQTRCEVGQRNKDEGSLVEPWVGQGEIWVIQHLVVHQEEIQIECAWSIRERPDAAKLALDPEQFLEKGRRGYQCAELDDRVEITRLVSIANGLGLIER